MGGLSQGQKPLAFTPSTRSLRRTRYFRVADNTSFARCYTAAHEKCRGIAPADYWLRMSRQKLYLFRCSAWMVAWLLFPSGLSAQFGTETLPDQNVGRPPQAPLITFLGIVTPGKLVTDPSLPPFGPVAQTLYEELRVDETPAGSAGEVMTSVKSTWDEAGRVIEEIRTDRGSESDTINRYEGARLVGQESTFPNSRQLKPKLWSYWVCDKSAKLIEFRRGSGDQIQNHDTNFKRDSQGRLTSYEYRQGPKDELFSRTELRYSADGKAADVTDYDASGAVITSWTQTVDEQGHVAMLIIRDRDWQTQQMKAPVKIAFRYDEKGRLIEQDTDAHASDDSTGEGEPPPGMVSIAYDDAKHTKTTTYAGDEGLLALTVTQNARGATVRFVGGMNGRTLDTLVNCTYDTHGNWTTCQQIDQTSGGHRVERMWRRTITYR